MVKKDKPNKNKKIAVILLFALTFFAGWGLGLESGKVSRIGYTPSHIEKGTEGARADFSVFWRAWELIEKNYDGKIDYEKMINGAITGMVNSLEDPYTNYLSAEDAKELANELSGLISGIGAEVGTRDNKLVIIAPIDESPAKKAGLIAGDHISKINDESTIGMDINIAISKIRGPKDTKVKLHIVRNGQEKVFEITRGVISIKSVKHKIVNKNIGHITVSRFDENTAELIRDAVLDIKSKNVDKIVLDMRDNPGGYLESSVAVSSIFIKDGVIVTEKKDAVLGKKKEYKARGNGPATDSSIKMVVLINGGSASASEIVAGALKDYGRAVLVGENTFGKGSVQELENLSRGAKLKITTAHWYTPKGSNIGKGGIAPDVEVKLTVDDINKGRDPQLDKAIEILVK